MKSYLALALTQAMTMTIFTFIFEKLTELIFPCLIMEES